MSRVQFEQIVKTKQIIDIIFDDQIIINGEFLLDKSNSYLKSYTDEDRALELRDRNVIFGILPDGSHVSFLKTVPSGYRLKIGLKRNPVEAKFFPHFVALGRSHIAPDQSFDRLMFEISDANSIFHDFDDFGIVNDPNLFIEKILADQSAKVGRKIVAGAVPILAYFTGNREILCAETAYGTISANHNPYGHVTHKNNISIENLISISIKFLEFYKLDAMFENLYSVIRFLNIVAGRRQILKKIDLFGSNEDKFGHSIYQCMDENEEEKRSELRSIDIPINACEDPDQFCRVLSNWIMLDEKRRQSRLQFSDCFLMGDFYDINRLVSAANMFDILPDDQFEQKPQLADDLSEARLKAKNIFKSLPYSDEKNQILGALGRLNKHNLKTKVTYRLKILNNVSQYDFQDIELVAKRAIDFRNYLVHGSSNNKNQNYWNCMFRQMPFFTSTLEFIFSISEFIEAGWNFNEWDAKGSTLSHPWGAYVAQYPYRINNFKNIFGLQ